MLSRGRERDLTGSQAIHLMPLPRSKTPAGPTPPRRDGTIGAVPAQTKAKTPAIIISRLRTRLWHLLPTLQERRCRRPGKARFRLAGWPLPGGRRTLWIAMKGFRTPCSFSSPELFLSQGSSTARRRSQAPSRSCAICRATRIASPSRTDGSSQLTTAVSRSAIRTIVPKAPNAGRR